MSQGQRLRAFLPGIALTVSTMILAAPAMAQAPTIQEQLAAQYKVAKMGSDSSGYQIVEEGTLLAVQKGGILGLPYKSTIWPSATYSNGAIKASAAQSLTTGKAHDIGSKLCGLTHKCPQQPDSTNNETSTKLFKVGDKVYATKIDVKPDKDQVVLSIVACDSCNKTDPTTFNKANVVFQFQSGSLAKASAGDVEDTIGQVLSISDSQDQGGNNDQQQGDQQQQGNQQQGQQQAQGGQQQQQQQEPQTVQVGMTPDQVIAALGKPDQQFNVGPKQIYVYKTASVKVTFFAGKVIDVQ
jgi:hypothetical protein